MPDVKLLVNGVEYGGWKQVTITRGIEAIAGGFSLSVSERWNPTMAPWPIEEEDECSILVGGVPVITGWVDKTTMKIGSGEHTLTFEGRCKTGALVDCSADLKEWEFNKTPILELCRKLAEPFGIPVTLQAGVADKAISLRTTTKTGKVLAGGAPQAGVAGKSSSMSIGSPIAKTAAALGDSPFDVIDRACRVVGLLPVSDGRGGLLLTRTGGVRATTALVLGENGLSAELTRDATKKYRTYKIAGQAAGSDEFNGESAASVMGTATDPNVKRSHRVLIVPVTGEGTLTPAFAKQRAGWEATSRAARAADLKVSVQGWEQQDGSIWPINAIVPVRIPPLNVDGDRLIVQTEMTLSVEGGTNTAFLLAHPDSYTPEPVIEKKTSTGGAGLTLPASFR